MERVLGIEVPPSLWESWWSWLAPSPQPFFVHKAMAADLAEGMGALTPEQRHTYALWGVDDTDVAVAWLDERTFEELPRTQRAVLVREQVVRRRGEVPSVRRWADLVDPGLLREQADGHRFVWWPSMAEGTTRRAIVRRRVLHDQVPSRHREVPYPVWTAAARPLPGARDLAGTFPERGEHNCFGTVMAAAGAMDPAATWADREATEAWLATATAPCGRGTDDLPGTVLLWRNASGEVDHAAVTIGAGWAFEKCSEDWWRPRHVLAVADVIRAARYAGNRLERRSMR